MSVGILGSQPACQGSILATIHTGAAGAGSHRIPIDQPLFDTTGATMIDTATGELVVPRDGVYLFELEAEYQAVDAAEALVIAELEMYIAITGGSIGRALTLVPVGTMSVNPIPNGLGYIETCAIATAPFLAGDRLACEYLLGVLEATADHVDIVGVWASLTRLSGL